MNGHDLLDDRLLVDGITVNRGGRQADRYVVSPFSGGGGLGGNRLDKAEKGKKKKGEGEQRTLVAMEGRWIQSPLQSHPIASCNELFLRQEG